MMYYYTLDNVIAGIIYISLYSGWIVCLMIFISAFWFITSIIEEAHEREQREWRIKKTFIWLPEKELDNPAQKIEVKLS